MRRRPLRLAVPVPLVVAAFGALYGCEESSPSGAGSLAPSGSSTPSIPGAPDGGVSIDGGASTGVTPGAANTILGLASTGEIVRIGLAENGTDERLGFPKLDGVEIRSVSAIARGPRGLIGLDRKKTAGTSLVHIDTTGLQVTPFTNDLGLNMPDKEALAFGADTVFGTDQFGPVISLGLDGLWKGFLVRQANSATDPIQCSTPEDLLWDGELLAAGSCANPDGLDAPGNGFYVWAYVFGNPGTTAQGGTPTDKAPRYASPERILGLGRGGAGLVATSGQRNLLVLSGSSFVVQRQLAMVIDDLE